MNSRFQSWLGDQLQILKDQHLYKVPKILETPAGGRVRMNGKEVVNLSSNNYLGLANHPKIVDAAKEATRKYGVGPAAVRTIAGTTDLHLQLEQRLAKFKGAEDVITFQSGFTANLGTIAALVGKDAARAEQFVADLVKGARTPFGKYPNPLVGGELLRQGSGFRIDLLCNRGRRLDAWRPAKRLPFPRCWNRMRHTRAVWSPL